MVNGISQFKNIKTFSMIILLPLFNEKKPQTLEVSPVVRK